jgi:hypothetical protein
VVSKAAFNIFPSVFDILLQLPPNYLTIGTHLFVIALAFSILMFTPFFSQSSQYVFGNADVSG